MYRAGQLRERIQIFKIENVSDGMGGHTGSPVIVAEPWAYVRQLSSKEQFANQHLQLASTCMFVIRRRVSPLTESMYIVWSGRRFDIKSISLQRISDSFVEIVGALLNG